MSTLYLRIPAREVLLSAQQSSVESFSSEQVQTAQIPFALTGKDGAIVRQGHSQLAHLPRANSTVLILSARDVLLLELDVPRSLTGARLKQALPHLLEDQLIQDVSQSHIALGQRTALHQEGKHNTDRIQIGLVQQTWLKTWHEALYAAKHTHLRAIPAQLCLVSKEDAAQSALILLGGLNEGFVECTVRQSNEQNSLIAYGLTTPTLQLTELFSSLLPGKEVQFLIDQVAAPLPSMQVPTTPFTWANWIERADKATMDICQQEFSGNGWSLSQKIDWVKWSLPFKISLGALALQLLCMNIYWFALAYQAWQIKSDMSHLLVSTFPNTPAGANNPLKQMHTEIQEIRSAAGQLSPGDFLVLSSALSETLEMMGLEASSTLSHLEYRKNELLVQFKPEISIKASDLKANLQQRGLNGRLQGNKWIIGPA